MWIDLQEMPNWAEAVQAVVAFLGFIILWWQINGLKKAVHSETQAKLYDHYTNVVALILERPYLRPYLYKDDPVPGESEEAAKRRREVETMCEIMAGLLEHGLLQKDNLPTKAWRQCWESFISARVNESQPLCHFVKRNEQWYVKLFRDLFPADCDRAGLTR